MNYIILGSLIVVGFIVLVIYSYNKFATQKVAINGAWAGIDTELKRRHDLIPNLVAIAKGYANFESSTLEAVAKARSNAVNSEDQTPSKRGSYESNLEGSLKGLLAVMESYPELKASQEFLNLQTELTNTEDKIAAGRRFYNAKVRIYEMHVVSFPALIIAKMGGFTTSDFEFFQAEKIDTEPVKVTL